MILVLLLLCAILLSRVITETLGLLVGMLMPILSIW